MKFYKKSGLIYKHNMFVDGDNNIISPAHETPLAQLARLDIALQASRHIKSLPDAVEAPSLAKFKRVGEDRKWEPLDPAPTPILDKEIKDAIAFVDELNDAAHTEKINTILMTKLSRLCDWACEDEFVGFDDKYCDAIYSHLFNPLTVTFDDIRLAVAEMVVDGTWDSCWQYAQEQHVYIV